MRNSGCFQMTSLRSIYGILTNFVRHRTAPGYCVVRWSQDHLRQQPLPTRKRIHSRKSQTTLAFGRAVHEAMQAEKPLVIDGMEAEPGALGMPDGFEHYMQADMKLLADTALYMNRPDTFEGLPFYRAYYDAFMADCAK